MSESQSFSSHRRWFPPFHFIALPVFMLHVIATSWHAYRIPTMWNHWNVVVAVALVALTLAARVMALTVQDRLIKLEQRLRMQAVLPAPLFARTEGLSRKHYVGLRYAGDNELAGLVERCLSGELKTDEDVKKQVKNWQADWIRA